MNFLYLSHCVSNECARELSGMGYILCLLPDFAQLKGATASHADTLIYSDGGRLILPSEYYRDNKKLFEPVEDRIITTDAVFSPRYPGDIALNALTAGGRVFGKRDALCHEISDYSDVVDVAQGYARCSTAKIGENAVITADGGIADACAMHSVEVLRISCGGIILPGYDYGFIGGASFFSRGRLLFFGALESHPDCEKIREYCSLHRVETVSLSGEKLCDIGGAVDVERPDSV